MLIRSQYEAFFGSIERAGKGSVQTLFYHFLGLPLFPQETYWVSGDTLFGGSNLRVTPLRRSLPSIAIGYLRGCLTVGALWVLGIGAFLAIVVQEPLFLGDPLFFGRTILGVVTIALGLVAAMVAVVAWILTRRALSADELARRAVFQQLLGTGCDPRMLENPWSERDGLKRQMSSIAEAMGLGRSFDGWSALVTRNDVPLPAHFLRMAMTVARLEHAAPSDGTNVASMPALEEHAWQRLLVLEPNARTARPV